MWYFIRLIISIVALSASLFYLRQWYYWIDYDNPELRAVCPPERLCFILNLQSLSPVVFFASIATAMMVDTLLVSCICAIIAFLSVVSFFVGGHILRLVQNKAYSEDKSKMNSAIGAITSLWKADDITGARIKLEEALIQYPLNPDLNRVAVLFFRKMGDQNRAILELGCYLATDPTNWGIYKKMAFLLREQGQVASAEKILATGWIYYQKYQRSMYGRVLPKAKANYFNNSFLNDC